MNLPLVSDKHQRIAQKLISSLILILTPWMLLIFISFFVIKTSILNITPHTSDELSYWHETLSLYTKGLDFGYYSINEQLPKFLSFGMHGFGTVSIYATFAKVFGWNYYSIVLANNLFISIAFFIFLLMVKIPNKIAT